MKISDTVARRDYSLKRDNFKLFENVKSELIFGNPDNISHPWFSYVVPTYKRADLLEETLKSILNQKDIDRPWNILVVDNECGGVNETEMLIRKIDSTRILYYRNRENIGVCANYNRCIELATSEWIGMIHADDLLMEDHLELVSQYIDYAETKRKKCAYISMSYEDFTDSKQIYLSREKNPQYYSYYGKLKAFTKTQALITGYSVSLPSFGTVMNRKIMLKEGGFDDSLGICEDVIIPYRLTDKYAVYLAPKTMGFHRNDRNESVKTETIFKIIEEMSAFREYMYSRNVFSKIWGNIARGPHFFSLVNYCVYLSNLGIKPLETEDFIYIYPSLKLTDDRNLIHEVINELYCRITGCYTFEMTLNLELDILFPDIDFNKKIYIYGAGNVGKHIFKRLSNKYKKKISGFVVSELAEKAKKNDSVWRIDDIQDKKEDVFIIIASAILGNVQEMNKRLIEMGFQNYTILQSGYRKLFLNEES